MGIFSDIFFKLTSEKRLRKKSDKMLKKLQKVGFFEKEGNKHMRLANKYNRYVNAIGGKCAKKLPKREHGWYLNKKWLKSIYAECGKSQSIKQVVWK